MRSLSNYDSTVARCVSCVFMASSCKLNCLITSQTPGQGRDYDRMIRNCYNNVPLSAPLMMVACSPYSQSKKKTRLLFTLCPCSHKPPVSTALGYCLIYSTWWNYIDSAREQQSHYCSIDV